MIKQQTGSAWVNISSSYVTDKLCEYYTSIILQTDPVLIQLFGANLHIYSVYFRFVFVSVCDI